MTRHWLSQLLIEFSTKSSCSYNLSQWLVQQELLLQPHSIVKIPQSLNRKFKSILSQDPNHQTRSLRPRSLIICIEGSRRVSPQNLKPLLPTLNPKRNLSIMESWELLTPRLTLSNMNIRCRPSERQGKLEERPRKRHSAHLALMRSCSLPSMSRQGTRRPSKTFSKWWRKTYKRRNCKDLFSNANRASGAPSQT